MKRFLFIMAVCAMLASCAPSTYYQMYQTQPITNIKVEERCMTFEDENCKILYNFWKEYGDIGFVFFNKTSENIYLHLDECFYVENGVSYDYYRNRVFSYGSTYFINSQLASISGYGTKATNASANANYYATGAYGQGNAYGNQYVYKNGYVNASSVSVTNSSTNSVSVAEKKVICVPPRTSKIITEFDIKQSVYRSCDLYRNPGKKDNHSLTFTTSNTPLTFGNRIAYSVGEAENLIRINNDFYVSKISNYSMSDITNLEDAIECGKRVSNEKVRVFRESGPNQFYIRYTLSDNLDKKH